MSGTRYRSWLRSGQSSPVKTGAPPEIRADLSGAATAEAGTLVKATEFTRLDGAVGLNGKDEALHFALPDGFGQGDYSVAVRVRVRELPEKRLGEIFSAWCGSGDDPLRLVVQDGGIHARIENAAGSTGTGPWPVKRGEWQHVAAVKEGGALTLYIDGVAVAATGAPEKLATKSRRCALGANPLFSGNEFLPADFAKFTLHTRALSDEEVAELAK
jgi:hypothetical protein